MYRSPTMLARQATPSSSERCMTNFRPPTNRANQNGVIFFPGSAALYKSGLLVCGFGVSGDGVDQDDVVTAFGAAGFDVSAGVPRADDVFVRGVRLLYQKFLRNPEAVDPLSPPLPSEAIGGR